MPKNEEQYFNKLVSENEWAIIQDIRRLEFGEVVIFVQNRCPYRKEVRESIKLKESEGLDKGQELE